MGREHLENMALGDSFFIKPENLPGPAQVVTISEVHYWDDGIWAAEPVRVLNFHEIPDGDLVLRKLNKERVMALYTTNGLTWPGKKLLLYRTRTSYAGRPCPGVRVSHPDEVPPELVIDEHGQPVTLTPPPAEGSGDG